MNVTTDVPNARYDATVPGSPRRITLDSTTSSAAADGFTLDAGVNLLPTAWWYKHDLYPAQDVHGTAEPSIFVGPLCMNIDVVRDRILFPPLRACDRIIVDRIGAYNVTQWMQFIAARPNVVMVSPNGTSAIIRRAETLETLVQQEAMPAWLA